MLSCHYDRMSFYVTGGGRGIGFEIARHFGQEGARLTIFDWAKDLLDDATQKLTKEGFEVHPFQRRPLCQQLAQHSIRQK